MQGNFSNQRTNVFHYNIWGHNLGTCLLTDPIHAKYEFTSGISRDLPASDFLVTLGGWTRFSKEVGTVLEQAGTLMHELGHNLSLKHGGNDHGNYKPNYISIMNYAFQTRGVRISGSDGNFDYSRFQLPSLNEAHLNETIGLSGVAGTANYGTRFYDSSGTEKTVDDINEPIDWNGDGDEGADTDISVNINKDTVNIVNSKIETLGNTNDWDGLVFSGGALGHLGENIELPVVVDDPEAALVDITESEDASILTDIAVSVNWAI